MAPRTSGHPRTMTRSLSAIAVLVLFTVFSVWVILTRGYLGFLVVARDEPWGLQMLLDLVIACTFALAWLRQDARKHGIVTTWPYVVATPFVGSISLLAYLVRRNLRGGAR